jgi:hypothetical protein
MSDIKKVLDVIPYARCEYYFQENFYLPIEYEKILDWIDK